MEQISSPVKLWRVSCTYQTDPPTTLLCQDSNKPIYLYINSAGGSVIAGLSIYDTMQT